MTDPLYPYERIKLVRDVVSAKIMAGLGVPTVEYRLARAKLDGREVLGIESPFVPMSSLKHAPELADKIVNSDDFVRGSVIDAWLGNVDRIQNRGNLWVQESPEGPRVIFGDYDQGLRLGLEIFGVPKVPTGVFGRHAAKSPEALRRAVADILALSDAEISTFVDSASRTYGLRRNPRPTSSRLMRIATPAPPDPFIGLPPRPPIAAAARCGRRGALADGVPRAASGRRQVHPRRRGLKELISLGTSPRRSSRRALFNASSARASRTRRNRRRARAVPRCSRRASSICASSLPRPWPQERGTTDDRLARLSSAPPGGTVICTDTGNRGTRPENFGRLRRGCASASTSWSSI